MLRKHTVFLYVITVFMLFGCANRGNVSGGEKDVEPPIITKTSPENFSVNFNSKEINISFNEYVKLKDIRKQLIVSPPMEYDLTITPMGSASKTITIVINDTLQENTTYAINFGQSIVDNNEENPYSFYRYVFSTGNVIDSLSVSGAIADALNRTADQFVSVMLYPIDSTFKDSTIYKTKPKYITNTLDSTTTFKIENIKEGRYRLIALKDENSNYTYEPKFDKIGFHESDITVPTDSTFNINLFKEELDFKVFRLSQIGEQRIVFPYQGDFKDMQIEVISRLPETFASVTTKDPETDSMYYWYKPKLEMDSVIFVVKRNAYRDTLVHRINSATKDSLTISALQSGSLNFYEDFTIEGSTPMVAYDQSKMNIIDKDSVMVPFELVNDSLFNRYLFEFDKTEEQKYTIKLLPEAITDFFGTTNDTLIYSINTRLKSNYGNIRINLQNATLPVIVQLVDDRNEVKYQRIATTSPVVDFNDLQPRTYYLRAIYDVNDNGKYDTGSYLLKQQPERVSYLAEPIEVRANFDFIIDFRLLD
ncbi:MAG: hypothetical protein HKP45_06490 [Winogradskyella sp.]|nr:hypothetical protein [Winogradskyella sp.]